MEFEMEGEKIHYKTSIATHFYFNNYFGFYFPTI